jgi:periplasmic divalent cation tolerance protein
MTPYCVVLTTTSSEQQAEALAKKIVEHKLAACVQVQQIRSYYLWQGEACDAPECLLFIKTRKAQYQALEDVIRLNHPYEIPEIIQLPIAAGLPDYLRWIDEATGA